MKREEQSFEERTTQTSKKRNEGPKGLSLYVALRPEMKNEHAMHLLVDRNRIDFHYQSA